MWGTGCAVGRIGIKLGNTVQEGEAKLRYRGVVVGMEGEISLVRVVT